MSQAGRLFDGNILPDIETLTGNSGGAVGPTGGNINVVGDGTTISIAGNPGTSTLTASFIGSTNISITGDTGGALVGNAFTFTGGTTGLSFGGAGTTQTLTFAGITANGGTVSLATDATVSTVNIGTGAGAKTVTMGSTNTTSSLTLNSGSGGVKATGVASVVVGNKNYVTIDTVTGDLGSDAGPSSSISITGDVGGTLSGSSFTFTGGSSGAVFTGSGSTFTESFTILQLPETTSNSLGIINIGATYFMHGYGAGADDNTFVGRNSGNFTMTVGSAQFNNGIGGRTLLALTTGYGNNCMGYNSGQALSSGVQNSLVGTGAGSNISTGNSNCVMGNGAVQTLTSGDSNIGIGQQALVFLASGSNNIGIGYLNVGLSYTGAESNNILLSNNGIVGESNVMRLGTTGGGAGQVNATYIAAVFGTTVGISGIPVVVDNVGQFGTVVSSLRYKDNIQDMGNSSEDIYKLRPVVFNYKWDKEGKQRCYGLVAEEVLKSFPDLGVFNIEGEPETVKYLDLIPMLLNEVQKLRKEIDILKER